jgi:anaerobic ribonucleoside-triphosphate reductase
MILEGGSSMIKKIIKRDGRVVDFDQERIINAIYKAAKSVGEEDRYMAAELSNQVVDRLVEKYDGRIPTVEDIQDIVERVLIENGHADAAKAYILYRRQHQEMREFKNLMLNAEKMVNDYLSVEDWRVNENSNMNYSLQGLNNHIVSAVTSKYWLERIYPDAIKDAHINGDFHLHDLGSLSAYCCGWDLKDLLLRGFGGVPEKVESGPAKHFSVALGQLVNFFYTLQGEAAGAQAVSSIDTLLAPFIYYDGLTYNEVKQEIQEFIFMLNVPTRVGFQTPFTNITLDLVCPSTLANEPVIIGGKPQEKTYSEFQKEMNMFNRAFCEVMMAGDAKGRIFSFPIPTYNVTEETDWDGDIMTLIMEMTRKYGIPYFANFVNSDMKPEDVRSMCCRLRLDTSQLSKRGGGLFGANPLTGSIGVVTINMARIGYKAKSKEEFIDRLDRLMDLARESLAIKRKNLERMTDMGLYPYSRYYLSDIKERFGEYWKNHFNTIGLMGMNEALMNFMGCDITAPEGHSFALEVLEHMRGRLVEYQEESGDLFNLEATPGESTTYRLARLDKASCPGIIQAGTDEEPYYTNSTQLPVGYTEDVFQALDMQEDLQIKYTGGTVFHGFLGERIEDLEVCKDLIKKVMRNYEIPYFTVTPTFSICYSHGYIIGEEPICPTCGRETEIWSRVVGFYRPVKNWNKGKQSEFAERKEFTI